jgi:hypothetical protein
MVDLRDEREPGGPPDTAAYGFLENVVRTNAVTFGNDRTTRDWSAGYYVNNPWFRVAELRSGAATSVPPGVTIRTAWEQAYIWLEEIVMGTISGTTKPDAPETGTAKSA